MNRESAFALYHIIVMFRISVIGERTIVNNLCRIVRVVLEWKMIIELGLPQFHKCYIISNFCSYHLQLFTINYAESRSVNSSFFMQTVDNEVVKFLVYDKFTSGDIFQTNNPDVKGV